jgi:kinesin family protein C2/C3
LQQNTVIKTREEKYGSKIKALELLVNGTNEENQVHLFTWWSGEIIEV